jgi:hypothetical protein
MKPFHLFILGLILLVAQTLRGQETISINASSLKKVTVYSSGCYIERTAQFKAPEGVSTLAIKALSPDIEEGSIQVKADGTFTILSVQTQQFHPVKKIKPKQLGRLLAEKDSLLEQHKLLDPKLFTLQKEKEFVSRNRKLSGKKRQTTLSELKLNVDYYRQRMLEIETETKHIYKTKETLSQRIQDIDEQLNEDGNADSQAKPEGWVLVGISANNAVDGKLTFSYFVPKASWTPVYDFRIEEPGTPITVIQKAMVQQNTQEDWKDVHLVLSSGRPTLSGEKPELKPLTLAMVEANTQVYGSSNIKTGYNNATVDPSQGGVIKGKVVDKNTNEPVPFANVILEKDNHQITGTTTDFDGNYTLGPISTGFYTIRCSYVGYQTSFTTDLLVETGRIKFNNIKLDATATSLTGVEVTSYKVPVIERDYTATGATVDSKQIEKLPNRSANAVATTVGGVFSYDGDRKRGESGEPMTLYIDGVKVPNNSYKLPPNPNELKSATLPGTPELVKRNPIEISRIQPIGSASKSTSNERTELLNAATPITTNFAVASSINKEFDIDIPYSIPADNKEYQVQVGQFDMRAAMHVETVPKLEPTAFLVAAIANWESYDLLTAEANLFVKGTFIGKTKLNTAEVNDTLMLSVGRDAGVMVERRKLADKSGKTSSGNHIIQNLTFEISLRNTHPKAINIQLEDQIPVSTQSSLKVELLDAGNAKFTEKDGKLSWELSLAPSETKKITFSYMVKYPRTTYLEK